MELRVATRTVGRTVALYPAYAGITYRRTIMLEEILDDRPLQLIHLLLRPLPLLFSADTLPCTFPVRRLYSLVGASLERFSTVCRATACEFTHYSQHQLSLHYINY
ncbi:hypothetical protein AB6A40_008358 [Gnathostoma spinigerum]|uniref:Uncharacterized protein n=1 Tax=Gnathostoma spinigerum TaxID=75299 RepID=A0ABD6EWK8_9BILA